MSLIIQEARWRAEDQEVADDTGTEGRDCLKVIILESMFLGDYARVWFQSACEVSRRYSSRQVLDAATSTVEVLISADNPLPND